MVNCNNCGAPVSTTSTKCHVCGSTPHLNPTPPNPVIPHGYCGSCGTAIRKIVLSGRGTFYCRKCQR